MTDKLRAFLALDLASEVRTKVENLIEQLKQQVANVKWTKPENLHITLRFLGNINPEKGKKIITQIANADIKPISITLTDLIIFPSPQNPIALVLKPGPIAALIKLNRIIEEAIVDCEIQHEPKPFVPHLTLGKIKTKNLKLPKIELPKMQWDIKDIKLFRSEASNDGSKYTEIPPTPL